MEVGFGVLLTVMVGSESCGGDNGSGIGGRSGGNDGGNGGGVFVVVLIVVIARKVFVGCDRDSGGSGYDRFANSCSMLEGVVVVVMVDRVVVLILKVM